MRRATGSSSIRPAQWLKASPKACEAKVIEKSIGRSCRLYTGQKCGGGVTSYSGTGRL